MEPSSSSDSEPVLTELTKMVHGTPKKPRVKQEAESSEYEMSEADDGGLSADEQMPSTSEVQEEIEDLDSTKTAPKRKKNDLVVDTYGPYHFKKDNTSSYMPFVPLRWTPQITYRLPTDIILDTIRGSGTEGLGRYEIGQALGYDATTKSGGRKITGYITNVINEHPEHIGQFQKMNGKVRTIRYYWKESEQPEKFEQLMSEFRHLSGVPCPFKIGEVIKFPEKKLNTLRISDITLKRLNRLLLMVKELRVVVTINRVIKHISEAEVADGYKFQIDKKSVMKCLLALQTKGFVRVWETTVRSDNVNYQIQIVTHGDIKNVEDPEIRKAIQETLDAYNKEGRVFPHGQLRAFKKPPPEETAKITEFDGNLEDVDEDLTKKRTIKDRYLFFRLQILRNSWKGRNAKDDPEDVTEDTLDDSQIDEDTEVVMEEAEGPEDDPAKAMSHLFSKNPAVPVKNKRSGQYYYGKDSLGYQGKTIRLLVLHEMAYNFVHGQKNPDMHPNVFDIFPPTQMFESWPSRDEFNAHVFYHEESPYRFMPPQPQYEGVDRGWFMLQDFLAALPLSVFVLANYVPTIIDRTELMAILQDPVKRHLPIGYLPTHIREILMKEKKVHKQIQHAFLLLGAMGLMAIGPNPSVRRFPGAASDFFYVAERTQLYDTSTSEKGYACVNPPVEQGKYCIYQYEFKSRIEVLMYWHHLRAIVQSTPLSYRMDDIPDSNGESHNQNRHKQYSIGVFDRKLVEHEQCPDIYKLEPRVQTDGVAGFDSALFIHLKRHWDLCTIPHTTVAWFIGKFRRCTADMKRVIEERVRSISKNWTDFTRISMADVDFMRSSNPLKVEYPMKTMKKFATNSLKPTKVPTPKATPTSFKKPKPEKPKKRKLDSVDIVSAQARISVRCRFSSKERDQLIMIRAVGFFLNPVYRFWLDPTVLRDLMHEFVPESRNKTVQSLMACGVRELVRPHRLAYLQRVVRNLSTFPEMRRLRTELCSTPVSPTQTKTAFFKDAFRTAMRLLFVDNNRIPSTTISDVNFRLFLERGRVSVTKEITVSNSVPLRSQKPFSYAHIQHCVATNILISVLIHSKNGAIPDKLIEQVPPAVLQTCLQTLRSDGLVSRSRTLEAIAELANKKDATLSYYFRHFFAHRFHSDLIENTGRLMDDVNEPTSSDSVELLGDGPEVVVAATNAFYSDRFDLDMEVENEILMAFSRVDTDQTIKKIRYLESADLHFEKIRVTLEKEPSEAALQTTSTASEEIEKIMKYFDKSHSLEPHISLDDYIQEHQFELSRRREIRAMCHVIKASKQAGITLKELSGKVKIPIDRIARILEDLEEGRQILGVGVDEKRWVRIEYEACWTVLLGDRRWCPRPWVSPEGTVSLPVVRWLAESVLLLIVGKLGIQLEDVITTYEFAVQPIAIREIIGLLEQLECIEIIKKSFTSPKLATPFDPPSSTQMITYIHPMVDGLEKFSKIFHHIELMPLMTAKTT